ncbi:MAG: DUF6787 family protein [Thermonemataceae bacterium]
MKWTEKLKQRWHIEHNWQIAVILVVFALTGFSAMYLKRFLFSWWGIDQLAWGWRLLLWFVIVLPLYQVLLLSYGFLFGQFNFFYKFVKKMFGIRG